MSHQHIIILDEKDDLDLSKAFRKSASKSIMEFRKELLMDGVKKILKKKKKKV